ncbi:tRNA pseudouridine(38-40) synthase TruA [Halegenticoccus tardaugens]|uniref:tRNA pseudouridine(38-40) synthase TruA n=1 Tax=Halegenticoccus tardaugens TaxID=2071624 RepID=UPI00100A5754|nr:tRNA pseudouridine(38-40) synthase TruA [Halegenticoccus tardaugens]
MSRRAFRVAYDGRPFHGFQRQPDVPTVEDALFDALRDLGVLAADAPKPAGYAAAGRTDAGVSAVAQTVALDCPDWCSPRALNSRLPASVRAWASADVAADFHATHDAVRRAYAYFLYAPAVDDGRARDALAALCGEHDFHNLTPDDRNTVRDLAGSIERDGDFLVVRVASDGFARELVRRIVSVVHAVAAGEADRSTIDRVLGPDALDGPAGVAPAPPTPLVLTGVEYPGVEFVADRDAAESAREAFGERYVAGRVAARVADAVRGGLAGIDSFDPVGKDPK